MKPIKLFYLLLRNAIWQDATYQGTVSRKEFDRINSIACRQRLQGLIGSTIGNLNSADRYTLFNSLFFSMSIEDKNKHLNELVVRLTSILQKHDIDHVVVKGQTIATLYKRPELRTPGDIDFYIAEKDQARLGAIIKDELGIDMPPFNEGRHTGFDLEDVGIEMHRQLVSFYSFIHRRRWKKIFTEEYKKKAFVEINGTAVPTLNPEMNILYTFAHFFFHLISQGCGLRQVIDLTVMTNAYKDTCDFDKLKTYLKQLGFYDTFCAVGGIMIARLGLPPKTFPYMITERHRRYGLKILKEIQKGGNFGHSKKRRFSGIGILHTLESVKIMIYQGVLLCRLSPLETLSMIPRTMILRLSNMIFKTSY